ncbi:MAG TPA: DUF3824 domain-containing protein, partial [Actinospica sp.]|jgi:hypothetical protein|nr:DUF3824 domain-containing protein [Actinospica sp.]
VDAALENGTISSGSRVNSGSVAIGGLIGIGMWIWMAFANRAGHNWARITGTVFFGVASLGLLGDITVFSSVGRWLGGGMSVLAVLFSLLPWLVGLFTVILLWRKESSAFFSPQTRVMWPYYPPSGYGYPIPPQGAPMQDAPPYPPQAPGDPWQTPGN